MSQQTINVGAAPNDGTGTPLRTAFQYTNSNFTELYTAVGPSGNNIVVPGNATITGDLTVDTNVLKVDTLNNRVGFGTASPAAGATTSTVGTTSVSASNYTAGSTWAARFEAAANNQPSGILLSGLTSNGLAVPGSLHVEPVAASSRSALIATYAADSAVGYFAINRFSPSAGTTTQHFKIADDGVATWSNVGGVAGTAMTLNSTGLGVGVTPSAWGSGYTAIQNRQTSWFATSARDANFSSNVYVDAVGYKYIATAQASLYTQYQGVHSWYNAASGTAGNAITFTQAMTLDASGNLLVGTTSALASGSTFQNLGSARQVLTLKNNDSTSYTLGLWSATTTGDNFFAYFGTETTLTVRGGISYNRAGGLVAYNTTSDYRAKDIIGPVSNSGSLIDSLKVYIGKMKGATVERPMLIAHEAQSVAPYAVTGTKDEVDSDGNPKYQQMDVSSFVPLLIAEIQSLRTRVAALES